MLSEYAVDGGITTRVIDAVRPVFDPRRIRVGNSYRVVINDDGSLRHFEYHVDNDQFLRVSSRRDGDAFDAELVPYVKERVEIALLGGIDEQHSSLVAALDGAGENVNLAILMADVFSGEIDFNNDLRRGDRFEVLFEKYFRENEFAGYGDVVAAEFLNDGRRVQAFRFQVPVADDALYYDEEGRSVKRLFLRSPFRFEPRITSRFSYRRLHPVLGTHRAHLGVDYGAPTGTPVIAVANGTVVSAERSGGSGNMVRLRHTNGYETYYLHLSSFAKATRRGARVVQGQMIGRVGSTGLSTGPHLDFRMRNNGTFVNPLLEHRKLPPGDPDGSWTPSSGMRFRGALATRFHEEGRSVKRLFLRSPFRFEPRITSRFSYRRLHPVLGTHRAHLGVDYGAPTGTPVIAVANGTVVSAERSGGSGNMVRLRHTNGYETYYLHLSSFARAEVRGLCRGR